jgi:class 3 adenylate cyclase
MPYPQRAVHRTILVVDVEGFGSPHRTNTNLLAVRDGLYHVLRQAFSNASIPWASCDHEDRGDGIFFLIPPDVPKSLVAEALPPALAAALRAHNSAHALTERIRLRMAMHAGEISYDDHGVAGTAINLTFRLIEAPTFKNLLAASPGVLALIASGWFFDEVVRHTQPAIPALYRPIAVTVKETMTVGWVCLPDCPCLPGSTGGLPGIGALSLPPPR